MIPLKNSLLLFRATRQAHHLMSNYAIFMSLARCLVVDFSLPLLLISKVSFLEKLAEMVEPLFSFQAYNSFIMTSFIVDENGISLALLPHSLPPSLHLNLDRCDICSDLFSSLPSRYRQLNKDTLLLFHKISSFSSEGPPLPPLPPLKVFLLVAGSFLLSLHPLHPSHSTSSIPHLACTSILPRFTVKGYTPLPLNSLRNTRIFS